VTHSRSPGLVEASLYFTHIGTEWLQGLSLLPSVRTLFRTQVSLGENLWAVVLDTFAEKQQTRKQQENLPLAPYVLFVVS